MIQVIAVSVNPRVAYGFLLTFIVNGGGEKNTPKFNKEYLWNHWTDLAQVKTIRRKISSSFLQFKIRWKHFLFVRIFLNTQKYNFN